MPRMPHKPRRPRDSEREAALESIAAEVRTRYAAILEEFPHHRASLEAARDKRLRGLK